MLLLVLTHCFSLGTNLNIGGNVIVTADNRQCSTESVTSTQIVCTLAGVNMMDLTNDFSLNVANLSQTSRR